MSTPPHLGPSIQPLSLCQHLCRRGRSALFEEIDTDHSGAISRYEAKIRTDLVSNFDEIDITTTILSRWMSI